VIAIAGNADSRSLALRNYVDSATELSHTVIGSGPPLPMIFDGVPVLGDIFGGRDGFVQLALARAGQPSCRLGERSDEALRALALGLLLPPTYHCWTLKRTEN